MRRKRKIAPFFPTHPPFDPITGEYASLMGEEGAMPYCALMQVAADDIYDNYVLCRGFDPRALVFVDYEAGNPDKPGISVAKPYGSRKTGTYNIGEIYPAFLPTQGNETYTPPSPSEVNFRLGQNPGVVIGPMEYGGQPSNLSSPIVPLFDHRGNVVHWMMLDGSGGSQEEDCEAVGLEPGTYPATSTGVIDPGGVGGILYGGTSYLAVNQSECPVKLGDRVSLHVSKHCQVFFTPCVCCEGDPVTPPECDPCCLSPFYLCVSAPFWRNGVPAIFLFIDKDEWKSMHESVLGLPNCPGGSLLNFVFNSVCCPNGPPIFTWSAFGGLSTLPLATGTFDLSPLCSDPLGTVTGTMEVEEGCVFDVEFGPYSGSYEDLPECSGSSPDPDPGSCCDQQLWFCVNSDSRQMPIAGGDQTWDLSTCCDCTSATLRLRTSCSNGVPRVRRTFTCDGVVVDDVVSLNSFCSGNAPLSISLSTAACFIQIQVTINNAGCDPCVNCCDESRWFCVDDVSKSITLSEGSDSFDVSACCECASATLSLSTTCNILNRTYRVDWSLVCDGGPAETGFDFFLCTGEAQVLNISTSCFLQVQMTTTNIGCAECGGQTETPPPPL